MYLRAKITIKGHVQGIGFRRFLKNYAIKLDLRGYTKNLPNKDVELLIEGLEEPVREMIEICKVGTKFSVIKDVNVEIEKYKGDLHSFEII